MGNSLSVSYPVSSPDAPTKIDAAKWTLADKILYGGLGYGAFTLPSNFLIIIITTLFPPLGQLINIMVSTITENPPFFTWDTLKVIFTPINLTKLIYSFLLTTLFYIPGLVYVLDNIVEGDNYASSSL